MRTVIIGGSGHIGTYLVPRLAEAGHEVINISRGNRKPYRPHGAWLNVRQIQADRAALEERGEFGALVRDAEPDIVIDLICFTPESAIQLVEALKGRVQHFLHCGTIWTHGHSVEVPTPEEAPKQPFGDYGLKKLAIEQYLLDQARRNGFPATILHPGHIVGPGWPPVNPQGNINPQIFSDLAHGREIALPNLGLETVHHVHADDVAQAFMRAIGRRAAALGEPFHTVSPAALTLRGYAERIAQWLGQPARLRYLPFEEWRKEVTARDAEITWDHIAHSPNASIEKARRLLGYEPRYSSLEAVKESVAWLVRNNMVSVRDGHFLKEQPQ
jgi:nucleoside-diphosphate-sugar epimerase